MASEPACAEGDDLESLDVTIAKPPGIIGYDSAIFVDLDSERRLWLMRDAFHDAGESSTLLDDDVTYLNNLAVLQEGPCFRAIHGGTVERPTEFEAGELPPTSRFQFLWALDGEMVRGKLVVFWAQMMVDWPRPAPSEGSRVRPIATWMATYDPDSLDLLTMVPAPNPGVSPQYGLPIVTEGFYTYLFGNSNLFSYTLEGGFFGEHSAVDMFLARVPVGAIDQRPSYFSDGGWTDDPTAATPISSRFTVANQMHPTLIGDRWVAVTKVDEYVGDRLVVDVADDPWGPWTTVYDEPVEVPIEREGQSAYFPIVLPWQAGDGTLCVLLSMNALTWDHAVEDPTLYTSYVAKLDVSDVPELAEIFGSGAAPG